MVNPLLIPTNFYRLHTCMCIDNGWQIVKGQKGVMAKLQLYMYAVNYGHKTTNEENLHVEVSGYWCIF